MLNLGALMRRTTAVAALLVVAQGELLAQTQGKARGSSPAAVEAETLKLLRALRNPNAPDPGMVAEQIHALGSEAIAPLMTMLKERQLRDPEDPRNSARKLSKTQTQAALDALGAFGRESVLPHWRLHFEDRDEDFLEPLETVAALRVLGSFGTEHDLDRVWEVAGAETEEPLCETLATNLELTTASILTRDPRAFDRLEVTWTRLPRSWRDEAVRAVGRTRDARGLGLFAEMMRLAPDQQRLVASQIPLLGPSNDPSINASLTESLLTQLNEGSKADVQTAALALAILEDFSVVADLLVLLDDERPGVPESAHRALCTLTNKSLQASGQSWRRWYDGERAWRRSGLESTLADLDSQDPGVVLSALREISRHRLERHELAFEVSQSLWSAHQSVRVMAAQVLFELDSRWGAAGLALALGDDSERVRDSAHEALVHIMGVDRGTEVEDWEECDFPRDFY